MAASPDPAAPAAAQKPSRIDLVNAWFKAHLDSEAGVACVTEDMVFNMPPSCGRALTMGLPWAGRDSLRRLGILDRALYETYGQASTMNLHFTIEEGDYVMMQFDSRFGAWNGRQYHNYYVMTIRFEGDEIAEVWDVTDTAYLEETILDTPESRAGYDERVARMRAEMKAPSDVW
ncbi:nuclear transport factor 2 family protein [Phenylobacterium sp.]|uniref:nuclear transport factor 2 family protein n=1 Tax=Phenylobacterium sp. TaxID=1871053 RepID=UPI002F42DEBE